jgi:hypothetical protein
MEAALIPKQKRTLEHCDQRFSVQRAVVRYGGVYGCCLQCAWCVVQDGHVVVGHHYAAGAFE